MSVDKLQRPAGTKDYLPEQAAKKRYLERRLNQVFSRWGYEEIITPTFEYEELLATATEGLQAKMYKFFNRQGETLALRPEMTAPIARLVATELKERPLPLRLAYQSNVFRYETPRAGRYREFYQAGVELFGVDTPLGDAEVIAVAVRSLEAAGLRNFQLDIGDVDYFTGIMETANVNSQVQSKIRAALSDRNFVELEELLLAAEMDSQHRTAILEGAQLRGGVEIIAEARELIDNKESQQALRNLELVVENLQQLGVEDYICLDLGVVRSFDYYTGVVFEGYSEDLGYTICGGGRYDQLVERFGYSVPATGFAVGTDRLLLSLENQGFRFPLPDKPALIVVSEQNKSVAFELAAQIRQAGSKAELEFSERSVAEISAYAEKEGIARVLVPGSQEVDAAYVNKEVQGIKVKEIVSGEEGLDE